MQSSCKDKSNGKQKGCWGSLDRAEREKKQHEKKGQREDGEKKGIPIRRAKWYRFTRRNLYKAFAAVPAEEEQAKQGAHKFLKKQIPSPHHRKRKMNKTKGDFHNGSHLIQAFCQFLACQRQRDLANSRYQQVIVNSTLLAIATLAFALLLFVLLRRLSHGVGETRGFEAGRIKQKLIYVQDQCTTEGTSSSFGSSKQVMRRRRPGRLLAGVLILVMAIPLWLMVTILPNDTGPVEPRNTTTAPSRSDVPRWNWLVAGLNTQLGLTGWFGTSSPCLLICPIDTSHFL